MTEKQERILIVDDEEVIRRLLCQELSTEGYQCQEAGNAEQALDKLKNNTTALVILDIKMPGKSGIELLPEIKASYPDTAVVMATATIDTNTAIQCMKQGAYDYLTKPFDMEEVIISVGRALEKRRLELENKDYQQHLEQMVETRTAELRQAIEKTKLASLETIFRLARAAEYRDEETGDHIKRMSHYAVILARKIGLSHETVEVILYAAPMHDIGKIGVPDHILLKPGKLNPDEWVIMKQHTIIGGSIVADSDAGFIKEAEVIASTHHEKWDGSGYPNGLKGAKIPLAGRIASVADVFDALTSRRPYRMEAYPAGIAFDIIREGRGNHFDPKLVDTLLAAKDEILAIKGKFKDEHESLAVQMTKS